MKWNSDQKSTISVISKRLLVLVLMGNQNEKTLSHKFVDVDNAIHNNLHTIWYERFFKSLIRVVKKK